MHVCVVGAGVSGLDAARHLLAEKCTVEVYERNEDVGGTWYYTDDVGTDKYGFPVYACMYTGLRTNLPKEVMGYADYKWPEEDKSYLTQAEVLAFLHKFADDFNLKPHIKLSTMVKEIRPLPGNRWSVTTVHIPSKAESTKEFDAVMVCSGHFNEGLYPNITGRESFKGVEVHSHDYRKPEPFKGKKVLIIGAGPSGIDLAIILSEYAESVILSHRSTMYFTTKFPDKVTLKPDVSLITESGASFSDDTTATVDTILYCTGYKYKFPFLHKDCKIVVEDDVYMKPLFKQIVNIEYPTMAFTGIPYRACSFPMYDLQIRYYMQYLNGSMVLPSKEDMYEELNKDIEKREQMGFTKKQYHLMNKHFVWDYYKGLAESANVENTWKSIVQLRLDCAKNVVGSLLTFRNDKYRIVDNDHYIKLNE